MFTKVEDSKMPQEGVDPRQALDAARLHVRRAWAGEVQGLEAWGGYDIAAEPLVIHDLNGQVLFYEFTVSSGKSQVGSIKTSASRVIGSPVVTIEFGPRTWSERKAVERAKQEARKRFPKARLSPPELVCYCYPKLGVRIWAEDNRGRRGVIVDVADGSVVERLGEGEGFSAYSFYDEVAEPQREVRLRRFAQADLEMETVRREGPELFKAEHLADVAKVRDFFVSRSVGLVEHVALYSSRVLKYGPRCSPHDCFQLYAQETDVYCAAATGQMILDFYRWNFTQDEIATAMSVGSGGANNTNQVAAYQSLSNQTLVATYDGSADWSEAKAEIDANRPIKSGVPHHARAVAGWKRQNMFIAGGAPKRSLLVYDPWPWDADPCAGGKIVWEDWDAVEHKNWITVRHRTTACG